MDGSPEDAAALQAVLPRLQRLTCLCLNVEDPPRPHAVPPAIATLPRLQRLCIDVWEDDLHLWEQLENVSLPLGPWLQAIRWLGLPWRVLAAAPGVLRGAPLLEYLAILHAPIKYGDTAADHSQWEEWWEFVATHPPLECLCIEIGMDEPPSSPLSQAMCALCHRRPSLRQRCVPFAAFIEEVKQLADIPSDRGSITV